jgi:hypothetical protein
MTNGEIARLRAANPVPVLPRVGAPPIFADVQPKSRWRRRWLVAAALAISALIGGPALAIGLGVINFQSSAPAPPQVVRDFATLSEGAPTGMDPGVIASETRKVPVHGHTLLIAPTRAGGLCYGWDRGPGGCDKLGTVPLSVSWLARPFRLAPGTQSPSSFDAAEGFAHARWVDGVEVRLADGTSVRPQLTWISKPIDAGFFRYVAPEGGAVVGVIGFRHGEAVIGEQIGKRRGPHPYARLDERKKLAEVETAAGPVRLWMAPTKTDGRCVWLQLRGQEHAVTPCLPAGYEHQAGLSLALYDFGGTSILAGECGYAVIELTRADRTSRTLECHDGIVFGRLQPAELNATVQALDKDGQPLRGSKIEVAHLRAAP